MNKRIIVLIFSISFLLINCSTKIEEDPNCCHKIKLLHYYYQLTPCEKVDFVDSLHMEGLERNYNSIDYIDYSIYYYNYNQFKHNNVGFDLYDWFKKDIEKITGIKSTIPDRPWVAYFSEDELQKDIANWQKALGCDTLP